MIIEINELSQNAYDRLIADCGNRIFADVQDAHERTYDVTLNHNAIFKVNGTRIMIDLAGKIGAINQVEFSNIKIF